MALTQPKTGKAGRTEDLRKEIESSSWSWRRPLSSRGFVIGVFIWMVFVAVVGGVAAWTREQPIVDSGRVMRSTKLASAPFEIADEAATELARSTARARTPRVYVAQGATLDELRTSLQNLPALVQGVSSAEEIEPTIRQQFGLTDQGIAALKRAAGNEAWTRSVGLLMFGLERTPILARETFQVETQALSKDMLLQLAEDRTVTVPSSMALNVDNPKLGDDLKARVMQAGFDPSLQGMVLTRLITPARPTFTFDAAATSVAQAEAVRQVPKQMVKYPEGEAIYKRGDVLSTTQLAVARELAAAEVRVARERSPQKLWASRAAVVAMIASIALAIAGYTALFVPRIRRNPARMAAIASLLGGLTIVAYVGTVFQPGLVAMTAIAPTVLGAMVLCIAYNQRIALAYACLHGVLVCVGLGLTVPMYAVMAGGVGAAVWWLKEIRDRDTLIKAAVFIAMALGLGTFIATLVELPMGSAALQLAVQDAGLAACGGLLVAGLTLFILPTLEKAFGITTGLTLIELRDPKQPLLRQLQQRAPGTYNHSLTLAALGEAAAEAIGADGLLTYVGALYHDIGKMNKPDYFVENQTPGLNRHDKLSPAMSLLVIVGHVKDGQELAREFNLPRQLWHFIESHHGTTLVEYFFHRAKRQAETAGALAAAGGMAGMGGSGESMPSELEYRYPGPKPRTKEAAIIMICDAVESAARAMADPTPSRIETLVRAIATKRLMDGQFDECDLTLRELNRIVESVSKTLASIYHGRIAYPGGNEPTRGQQAKNEPEVRTAAPRVPATARLQ